MKAYRHADGSVWLFRPDAERRPLRPSARRLALPVLAGRRLPRQHRGPGRGRPGVGARRRGAEPLPAAVHVRLGGLPRRPAGQAGHLLLHRQPGRALLRLRGQAGVDLDLHQLHPGRSRRHRRGQVRRQLRGQPGRPAGGGRPRLRPGDVRRRGRARLGRGAGRHERLPGHHRQRAGHPRAQRLDPRGRHPRLDPDPGQGVRPDAGRAPDQRRRAARGRRRRARSPRCSPAARRR